MNRGGSDRLWRRLIVAAPVSLIIHILLLMSSRPEYREVADYAIDLDVVEAKPGPPQKAPEPETEAPKAPEPAPKAPPPEQGFALSKEALEEKPVSAPDAGVLAAKETDAGVAVAAADADAGAGEGGICLHDLFPYAPADPSWLAWVSMASFRGTEFESGFARLLSSFTMYRDMAGASGLDPGKDVEGFLVTADPFDDAASYRVVATYDSGQAAMLEALKRSSARAPGFTLAETESGYEAAIPGKYRWHLVGSGRVLAVTSEKPANDAGPREASPDWPKDVTCLIELEAPEKKAKEPPPFAFVVRSLVRPDSEGHWPALVIATRDPRALGLPKGDKLPAKFLWGYAAIHFSEPMRVEGTVMFEGTGEQVEAVMVSWRSMIAAAAADPFLALAGLSGVLDHVKLTREGNRIRADLPLSKRQIQAALIMLEMQAGSVDELIVRKSAR